MLAYLSSKPQKPPIIWTCKPKKIYNCAIVPLQICNGTVAQLQTDLIYFIQYIYICLSLSLSLSLSPSISVSLLSWHCKPLSHISLSRWWCFLVWVMGLVALWSGGGVAWYGGFSRSMIGVVDGSLTVIGVACKFF